MFDSADRWRQRLYAAQSVLIDTMAAAAAWSKALSVRKPHWG